MPQLALQLRQLAAKVLDRRSQRARRRDTGGVGAVRALAQRGQHLPHTKRTMLQPVVLKPMTERRASGASPGRNSRTLFHRFILPAEAVCVRP
jgi:hypothetical protein